MYLLAFSHVILCTAGGVTVVGSKDGSGYSVYVEAAEPRAMVLHWAVDDWIAPPNDVLPDGTHRVGWRISMQCWSVKAGMAFR